MNRLWPTAGEAATLRFLLPLGGMPARTVFAAALFAAGLGLVALAPMALLPVGVVLLLLGHLPFWVHGQTTAPGGATPQHEEIWAPVEEGWMQRVETLERRGEEWDATPWDLSNARGCLMLVALLVVLGVGAVMFSLRFGMEGTTRLAAGGAALLVPLWLNGLRTTWNPSELRLKGRALEVARETAEGEGRGDFEEVPLLALRQGRRGKYPVDARLMLRPVTEDDSGFIGVQVQVALNNVRGTDYPYLYAVVLGRPGFRLPGGGSRPRRSGGKVAKWVYERGEGDGAGYLVIRQHADDHGGWHTEPEHIREIVARALDEARQAHADNLARTGEEP